MKKQAIPIYLFSFFMVMPGQALFPVLPLIRDEMNASYSQISIFVACLGIVRIVFAFPGGFLADRFDRRKILLLSGLLSIMGLLILSVSDNIFQLIVSRALIGMGSIICTITILVLLAQIASVDSRGVMMSMNNVVHHAGAIVSAALAGILAGWYDWRLPFLFIAGLILISMIMVSVSLTDQRPDRGRERDAGSVDAGFYLQKNFRAEISNLLPVFALSLFVLFYRGSFRHTLIPFYGKDVFHIDVMALGLYISLASFFGMVSLLIFGFVSDHYGRKVALIPGISFSMIAVAALYLPKESNPLLIACALVGAGSTINSMPNVLISDLVPSGSLGRVLGINRVFGDSGYFLGPIVVGSLLDHFGFRMPLFVVAGFSVFALILACFCVHNRPSETLKQ